MTTTAALRSAVPRRHAHEVGLLESKLSIPVQRPGSMPRAGLINRLRVARAAPVVHVNAPAGYGKTTVVAEWSRRDGRPFAWYGVDAADDPESFVAHLATAVARAVGGDATEWDGRRPDETVALLRHAIVASNSPIVVVLDDIDLLQGLEAARLLGCFAEELPPGSQLVLITRSDPPLPLARFRARGQLVEFGIDDLRFTNREASALLRIVGVDARQADIAVLNDAVEGWPAGLYLAALSLRSSGGNPAEADVGMMFDYFRGELLARLPDGEVRFLTRISVLDRLCGPLCDVVAETGGSADMLERLERSNMFIVPLDRERHWYRIHGVFRRALLAELQGREPAQVATLRKRAAEWCALHGDHDLAVDYARAAGNVELLSSLLVSSPLPFAATGRPARVQRWLEALDDDAVLERNPVLASIGALTWAMTGRADAADRWADAAERGSERARARRKATGGAWQALLRSLMSPSGVEEMCSNAERAVATLPLGSAWRAPALLVLGSAQALAGDIKRAESILAEAADTAASAGDKAVESVVLGYQSMLAATRGDHPRADALADAARRIVRDARLENYVASLFAVAASAQSALRRGDWSQVRADLERADDLLPRLTHAIASFAVLLRLEFARVHLALGDAEGGTRLLEEIEEIFARRPGFGLLRNETLQLRAQIEADAHRYAGKPATLTAAELRLLPLLTTHLSFREIAERLYVSRNTVKTQAISVYRKLGVTSRGDAIGRAGDLGLVGNAPDGRPS
jgi:LuxR family transcriptional regulator, maltose regulon positive regulatory protein